MTESYTFQILADVSRFAAEAGKVPGITEKQAAAATARFLAQQQAAQAQASGEDYEPPSWVFDKRIIGGADGSGCSSNYGEYMVELEGKKVVM